MCSSDTTTVLHLEDGTAALFPTRSGSFRLVYLVRKQLDRSLTSIEPLQEVFEQLEVSPLVGAQGTS